MTDITTTHADQIAADAEAAISAGVESYDDVEGFLQGDHGATAEALGLDSDDPQVSSYIAAVQAKVAAKLGWG